jgi:tRNA-2-methylthio-N6-dimethylallyladenosine synthase
MRFYIHTMGCQMNEYDSVKMAGLLEQAGHEQVATPEDADATIINTCHIREKSEHKVASLVGTFAELKRRRPDYVVGITGCVAQGVGKELLAKSPVLDFAIGSTELAKVPAVVEGLRAHTLAKVLADDVDRDPQTGKRNREALHYPFIAPDILPQRSTVSAFITVIKGCDKMCTFCVVPYTRGMEVSRATDEILAEGRAHIAHGARELVLLGQNVNGFRASKTEKPDFAGLLYKVGALEGLKRLRYTTSHPRHFDEPLARAFAEIPALCPYLHLPVQSGSDAVLDAMNRSYTAGDYKTKIDLARRFAPNLAVSTDLIVGFPGETDADFAATMRLVEEVGFESAFVFKYSPRPGTPAALLESQVPEGVKAERMTALLKLCDDLQWTTVRRYEGQSVEVLVEGPARDHASRWFGRTPDNRPVIFEGAANGGAGTGATPDTVDLTGMLVDVTIVKATPHALTGAVVAGGAPVLARAA